MTEVEVVFAVVAAGVDVVVHIRFPVGLSNVHSSQALHSALHFELA